LAAAALHEYQHYHTRSGCIRVDLFAHIFVKYGTRKYV
jgi:hypothetical protein